MTFNLASVIFITAIVLSVTCTYLIYGWLKKLKESDGKYQKLDKLLVPHTRKRNPLTYMEKRWKKKGYKWYRIKIINENGLVYKVFSVSEARFKTKTGLTTFSLKKLGAFVIDETCITFEEPDIPYITYVKGFPLPVKMEIPKKPECIEKYKDGTRLKKLTNNPKINTQFFSNIDLEYIITDSSVSQLVYNTDTETLKQYLMVMALMMGGTILVGIINLVLSIVG